MKDFSKPPNIALFQSPTTRENALLELEIYINDILKDAFEENSGNRAVQLVNLIEDIMALLKKHGYEVFRLNYSGDIRYEYSNQQWGQDWDSGPNAGLYFDFVGFGCKVSWHGESY